MLKKSEYLASGVGQAPNWANLKLADPEYEIRLIEALNWINVVYDTSDLKAGTLKWFENHNITTDIISSIHESQFQTIGKLCLIMNQGGEIKDQDWFNRKVEELQKFKAQVPKVEKVAPPVFIYTYNELNDLYDTGSWDNDQIFSTISKYQQTTTSLNSLKDWCSACIDELKLARSDFAEYFKGVSKPTLGLSTDFYQQVLLLIDNFTSNKKAVKRPKKANRSKKVQTAVKNLRYKKEDTNFRLVSVDPMTIIGSEALMVFNTKTRQLGLYVAEAGKTLSIRGSSVVDFDGAKSRSKLLRNPEDHLGQFRTSARKRVDQLMDGLASKERPMSGRLNAETVLLKKF